MKKFTEGKWEIADRVSTEIYSINGGRRKGIALIPYHNSEDKANARLIAAAPEMYDFIKAILVGFETEVEYHQMFDVAKQLLDRIDGTEEENA